MQPQIDITLVASPFCILNRKEDFSIYLKYRLHYQEPITINSSGSIYDPAATFAAKRIEVLDTVTKGAVNFETVPGESSEEQDHSFVLKPEVGSYFFWTTSTQSARWHEYPFNISSLTPNRKYTIAYRNHGISQWYSGSHLSMKGIPSNTEAQPGDSLQVSLIGDQHPKFTVREAIRPPPPVTASLLTSDPTCSISGQPPFTVFLTWKLHEKQSIYALVTREAGRVIGLEIRDPEKDGRRIGPPPDVLQGYFDNAPSNDEEIFVPLNGLEDMFSQEYTLATEERQNGLLHSDTWNLKHGKEYEMTLRKSKWRWIYQDEVKEEVRQDKAKVVESLQQEPCSVWKPDSQVKFNAE